MRVREAVAIAVMMVCVTSCTHVVRRRFDCYSPSPLGRSAIAWERGPGTGVSGRLLAATRLSPLYGSSVILRSIPRDSLIPSPRRTTGTDSVGGFRFDSVVAGKYELWARMLGYRAAADTIVVAADSGVIVTALLVRDNIRLDECGLTYWEERVPWWKW